MEGDIIHSISLGIAVESLIGGISRTNPETGKCVVDASGFLIFGPDANVLLVGAWNKFSKVDKRPKFAGFSKVGLKG
jgi:hypothetical protein